MTTVEVTESAQTVEVDDGSIVVVVQESVSVVTDHSNPASLGAFTTDDLAEGVSKLYHTTARARAAISGGTSIDYNSSTGVIDLGTHSHVISDVTGLQTALDGKSDTGHTHTASDVTDFNSSVNTLADARIALQKGAANGLATLGADTKIPNAQLPNLAITDTYVVASEVAMLALSDAETGDVAVRTDENKSYILAGSDYSTLGDWQELLTPTDAVQSVNGQTGTVSLDTDDVGEGSGNLYFTNARARAALSGTTNQINYNSGTGQFSTPQNIHTGASPSFVNVTLSGKTNGRFLYVTTGGQITENAAFSYLSGTLNMGSTGITTANIATGATTTNVGGQGDVFIGNYGDIYLNQSGGSSYKVIVGEATDIQLGTTTGTKIGTGTSQKLGFWNATPVVQQVLATGAGATVDNVITFLQTIGLCKQS